MKRDDDEMRKLLGNGEQVTAWPWVVFALVLVGLTLLGIVGAALDMQGGTLGITALGALGALGVVVVSAGGDAKGTGPVEKQGPEPSGNAAHPSDLARAVAKAVEVELSDAWVDERAPDIAGVVDRTLGKQSLVAGVASPLVVEAERLCALAEEHDAKATPGPWGEKCGDLKHYAFSTEPGEAFGVSLQEMHWQDGRDVPAHENASFIADARTAWPALAKVTRALIAENERLRVVSPKTIDVRTEQQSSAALRKEEEPFAGRYYGAVNIDGDNPAPLFLFDEEGDCWAEIKRRQALPEDDDNRLSEDWQALAFDIEGLFWNSYHPNPRPAPTTSRMWEMQREIERLEAKLLAKLREREQRVLVALRAYHAGADRGELKALLDEIWGPTPGKEMSGDGSVEQTAVKRTVAEVTDEEIVRAVARGGLGDLAEALGCHLWDGEGPLYDRIGVLLRRGVLDEPCCMLTLSTAEWARRIAARLGCFDRADEIAAVLKGEEG